MTGCGSECDSSAVLRCWKKSVGPDALRNQGSCRWGLRWGSTQAFFLCCHGHEPSGTQGLTIREIATAPCLLRHIFPSCGRAEDGDSEFRKVSEQDCVFPSKRAASVVFSTSWNHGCLKSN